MKRIAILAPYVGAVNRGAETFVIELTKKLSEQYLVDVYSMQMEPKIKDNIRVVDVKLPRLLRIHQRVYNSQRLYRRCVDRFYFLIPDVLLQRIFTRKAFEWIDQEKYDMLYPNNGVWGAAYSAKYRKKNGTPFIYTGHGGIGTGEKYIIENEPNVYVCLTDKHLNWANEVKTENVQTMVIPNGVNVRDFFLADGKNHIAKILSVAALTDFKRHELTIHAVSKLEDVELTILGKGEEEKTLRALADRLLPGRCAITSTSYDKVKEYYRSADLFVLPSREEPFGIVYLEAMASNLPVVAPDDAQRREIIGGAGLLCDVEDIDAYARTISEALTRNWDNVPRRRAEMYDWSKVSKKYMNLIENITGQR